MTLKKIRFRNLPRVLTPLLEQSYLNIIGYQKWNTTPYQNTSFKESIQMIWLTSKYARWWSWTWKRLFTNSRSPSTDIRLEKNKNAHKSSRWHQWSKWYQYVYVVQDPKSHRHPRLFSQAHGHTVTILVIPTTCKCLRKISKHTSLSLDSSIGWGRLLEHSTKLEARSDLCRDKIGGGFHWASGLLLYLRMGTVKGG